jgi:hypothetical protein
MMTSAVALLMQTYLCQAQILTAISLYAFFQFPRDQGKEQMKAGLDGKDMYLGINTSRTVVVKKLV